MTWSVEVVPAPVPGEPASPLIEAYAEVCEVALNGGGGVAPGLLGDRCLPGAEDHAECDHGRVLGGCVLDLGRECFARGAVAVVELGFAGVDLGVAGVEVGGVSLVDASLLDAVTGDQGQGDELLCSLGRGLALHEGGQPLAADGGGFSALWQVDTHGRAGCVGFMGWLWRQRIATLANVKAALLVARV